MESLKDPVMNHQLYTVLETSTNMINTKTEIHSAEGIKK